MAEQLAQTLEAFAGESGLLPEQVWDTTDIPERELYLGRASGSARPLVWAHAEYLKLCRSLQEARIFDRPPQTVQRYFIDKVTSHCVTWRFNNKVRTIPIDAALRIETRAPAVVHWSTDGWQTVHDIATRDTTLGVYIADVPTAQLAAGASVQFTFFWPEVQRWEGADFAIRVE